MLIIFTFFAAIIASSEAGYCKMSRDDTLYIYPSVNNCSVFIVCHHNEEYEMSCLEASLFHFADQRLCLDECSIEATTRRASRNSYDYATDYALFPAAGAPEKTALCPTVGETVAAIPHECREYIKCHDGIGTRNKCDNVMEFSPITHQCLPEDKSDCKVKKAKGIPNSKCRFEKGSSSTLLLPTKKCSDFEKCSHLMAWTVSCPQHCHFDAKTKTCDWEEKVSCGK